MKLLFLSLLLLAVSAIANAQTTTHSWHDDLDAYAQAEDVEDADWQDYYEILDQLHNNPININTATPDDLCQLPFLSEQQIEDIQYYIHRYGKMKSLGELIMIESLGYEARDLLLNFITLGEPASKGFPSIANLARYGQHELSLTGNIPFYRRQGDKEQYLGYPYKHSLRYGYHYGNYLKFGLVAANDAGEPFFSSHSTGYDHYSYYLLMKNLGHLKTLALGCYKLSFGMGLVVNNGLSFGKMSAISSLGRASNSIRAHSSKSSSNYFNGIAATVEVTRGVLVSAFLSNRNLDATISSGDTISAFVTTGYHRTQSEIDKRGNTNEKTAGGNISIKAGAFHIGATAIYSHLNRILQPKVTENTLYRKYYPAGTDFHNLGIDYGYSSSKLSFSGEVAMNGDHALATVNKLSYTPSYSLKLLALQRFYSYKYNSLYARSFSDGSRVQNESGVLASAQWSPSAHLTLTAYTDWFYTPWHTYYTSQSAYGTDNLIQAACSLKKCHFIARYQVKVKQRDNDTDALTNYIQHRMKLTFDYAASSLFSLKTQVNGNLVNFTTHEQGIMASQAATLCHTFPGHPDHCRLLRFSLSAGYFNTSDYASRVYAYEQNLAYTFYYPSFYGEGCRLAIMAQYSIKDRLQATAKLGHTRYFDRDEIGSALQLINSSRKTDLELQLIWKI